MDLAHERCHNHEDREAAAICRACDRFYCRECVTEHEGRVICASCLRKLVTPPLSTTLRLGPVLRLVQFAGAVLLLWLLFYSMGRLLLLIPSEYHEGTVWQKPWLEQE